jgi:uncharacterized protein YcfJ
MATASRLKTTLASISAAATVLAILLQGSVAAAQTQRTEPFHASSRFVPARPPQLRTTASRQIRPPVARGKQSIARQIGGAFIGGLLGFYVGGHIGAALEGNSCGCDDPGLRGLMIGAPAGAIIGGVIGARVAR